MKAKRGYLYLLFLSFSLFFITCKKSESSPTAPEPAKKYMFLNGYGSLLDSSYYKVWSDSSWEKFNRVVTVSGKTCVTLINSEGNEYFYDVIGYAGFKPKGESVIMFDHTLPQLPDSLVFNQSYVRETSFYYRGYIYTMKYEQSLMDTVAVSVAFGFFNPCLWFSSKATLSAGGQSDVQNTQFWLAKGPSDIRQTLNSGVTLVMVRGVVNGRSWGMGLFKTELHAKRLFGFEGAILSPLYKFQLQP